MNAKPEVGTFSETGAPGNARQPLGGWKMAAIASGLLALSVAAGLASLLAGALLMLPLVILALPFFIGRLMMKRRRPRALMWRFPRFRRA